MVKEGDHLFIMTDFDQVELYEGSIKKYYSTFLGGFKILPGRKTADEVMWRRAIISKKNKRIIRKHFKEEEVGGVVIFNDRTVECQYAAYMACVKGVPTVYAEDGIAAYLEPLDKTRNPLKDLASKVVFGRFYNNVKIIGTSEWVKNVQVFSPSLVIPQLGGMPIKGIDTGVFRKISPEFLDDFTRGIEDDLELIIVLPHSDILNTIPGGTSEGVENDMREHFLEIIKESRSRYQKIGIKYHPRETHDYLGEYSECHVLPKHVPMELIYLKQREGCLKEVIGPMSTSLYTARIIFGPGVKITLIRDRMTGAPADFLEALDIKSVDWASDRIAQ